jgi:hypothetical protein
MATLPPVPPANRSSEGPQSRPPVKPEVVQLPRRENLAEQGRQGNIKQNTTSQGYQQDR